VDKGRIPTKLQAYSIGTFAWNMMNTYIYLASKTKKWSKQSTYYYWASTYYAVFVFCSWRRLQKFMDSITINNSSYGSFDSKSSSNNRLWVTNSSKTLFHCVVWSKFNVKIQIDLDWAHALKVNWNMNETWANDYFCSRKKIKSNIYSAFKVPIGCCCMMRGPC